MRFPPVSYRGERSWDLGGLARDHRPQTFYGYIGAPKQSKSMRVFFCPLTSEVLRHQRRTLQILLGPNSEPQASADEVKLNSLRLAQQILASIGPGTIQLYKGLEQHETNSGLSCQMVQMSTSLPFGISTNIGRVLIKACSSYAKTCIPHHSAQGE